MYRVMYNGHIVAVFRVFLDAWLYVYLECDSYAHIYGPDPFDPEIDGDWSINPGHHHIH